MGVHYNSQGFTLGWITPAFQAGNGRAVAGSASGCREAGLPISTPRPTSPVGRYRPNASDLYDMHGNVAEWCSDWFTKEFYKSSRVDDPSGPALSQWREIRGGGWRSSPLPGCQSAARPHAYKPDNRTMHNGIRAALAP
jgi:formylglycine-generating enzyme required for sulfatase activity